MNNAELIRALRYCGNFEDREGCDEECPYFNDKDCPKRIMRDAVDALEAAEKRIAELMPKEGEWIIDGMNEYELSYGCIGYETCFVPRKEDADGERKDGERRSDEQQS